VDVLGDVLGVIGIAFAVPLVILAIGLPFAALVRVLMWIGEMF
jgi:hypothetical protein